MAGVLLLDGKMLYTGDLGKQVIEFSKDDLPDLHGAAVRIIGSVNGLVCFGCGGGRYTRQIRLYDPTVGDHSLLPHSGTVKLSEGRRFSASYGFGFDTSRADYTVVEVVQFSPGTVEMTTEVKLFHGSLWDTQPPGSFPDQILLADSSVGKFLNGGLYWIARRSGESNFSILRLNLHEGIWNDFVVVGFLDLRDRSLEIIRQRLCILGRTETHCVQIWEMNDSGGSVPSWEVIFSISAGNTPGPGRFIGHVPNGTDSGGNFLFEGSVFYPGELYGRKELIWYDFSGKQTRKFEAPEYDEATTFTMSVIPTAAALTGDPN